MKEFINTLIHRLKKSRFIQDSFWSLLGTVIGRGLSLAAGIFIARFLGKDIFGEYGMIKTSILTIATFSTYGLGYTATKFIADYKNNHREFIKPLIKYAINTTLLFCIIMASILLIYADYFADNVLNAPHLGNGLKIVSIIIILNGLTTTQIGILSGIGKFKRLAQINSISGIISFVFSIIFTYFWGFNGALFALVGTQFINWVLNYLEIRKFINTNNTNNTETQAKIPFTDILKFSTPVALQEMAYSLFVWLNSFLLMKLTSYGELGVYNAAMQWNAIILFIPSILRNVILAHLSENNQNEKAHNKIMKNTLIITLVAVTLPVLIIIILSPFIMDKLYGTTYSGLSSILSISIFSTIFISISNVYVQIYMSKNLNWLMFFIRFIRNITTLALFLILFYYFAIGGVYALVYSTLFSYALFTLIMIFVYKKSHTSIEIDKLTIN